MVAKYALGLTAATLLASTASALRLNIPKNPVSAASITVTWEVDSGDPGVFTLELVNEVFHNSFGIANNVATQLQTITLTLPVVPAGDGYQIEAVALGNINQIYDRTGQFNIASNPSVSGTVPGVTPSAVSPLSSSTSTSVTTTSVASTSSATSSSFVTSTTAATNSSMSATSTSSASMQSNTAVIPTSGATSNQIPAISAMTLAGSLLSLFFL